MALWGGVANSSNAPKNHPIVNNSNASGNVLYGNTTVGSFQNNAAIGVFGADQNTVASNTSLDLMSGWVLATHLTGGISSIAVNNTGLTFANGETILFSGGTQNTTASITTNSIGRMVSIGLNYGNGPGAGWSNNTGVTATFQRQKHLNNLTISVGGTGYNNTDTIKVSNAIINGTATVTTNSIGGLATTTLTNVGLFANNEANTDVVITVLAANGAASNGSTATIVANLTTSSTGNVTVSLGGNANRVRYETLAAMHGLVPDGSTTLPKA